MSKELRILLFRKFLRIKPNMSFEEFLKYEGEKRTDEQRRTERTY